MDVDGQIYIWGTVIIRIAAAVLWTVVVLRIFSNDRPVPRLVRQLIGLMIVFGLWIFVFGSLTPFGFPPEAARFIYTSFTAFAGLIAFAILTTSSTSPDGNDVHSDQSS